MAAITATLAWKGEEYELKYTFDIARKLRAEGVNIGAVYRAVLANPASAIDYGDDIAYTIAFLLRRAGARATDEEVWRLCLADEQYMRQAFALFSWVCDQHFATSDMAPKGDGSGKA